MTTLKDYITPLGGFLVIGFAFWITDRVAYRRGQRVERERHEAEQAKRLAKIMRSVRCEPSPVTLTLSGYPDDASAAAFLCRMFSGTERIVEESR